MATRFNKKNYSRETISRYSIIGSYFIHQIYNTIYSKAKKEWHNNRNKESLTYLYEKYLDNYSLLMKKDRDCRKKEFDGLFKYYISHTGFKSWTFTIFLNEITKEFFIVESENALTTPQKHEIFTKTMTNSLQSFISKLKHTYLGMIVDEHKNRENIKILQDEFIDCLIYRREEWSDKIENSGRTQYVPKSIVESISTERYSLEKKLNEVMNNEHVKENEYDEKTKQLTVACEKLRSLAMLSYKEVGKLKDINEYDKILQEKQLNEIENLKNHIENGKQNQASNANLNSQLQSENSSFKTTIETLFKKIEILKVKCGNLSKENKNITEENIKLNVQIKSEQDKISYISNQIKQDSQHEVRHSKNDRPFKKESNNPASIPDILGSLSLIPNVSIDNTDIDKSEDIINFNATSVDDLFA